MNTYIQTYYLWHYSLDWSSFSYRLNLYPRRKRLEMSLVENLPTSEYAALRWPFIPSWRTYWTSDLKTSISQEVKQHHMQTFANQYRYVKQDMEQRGRNIEVIRDSGTFGMPQTYARDHFSGGSNAQWSTKALEVAPVPSKIHAAEGEYRNGVVESCFLGTIGFCCRGSKLLEKVEAC